jgi:hypothetical protein
MAGSGSEMMADKFLKSTLFEFLISNSCSRYVLVISAVNENAGLGLRPTNVFNSIQSRDGGSGSGKDGAGCQITQDKTKRESHTVLYTIQSHLRFDDFAYYNFCKLHGAIRCTPAMAAGVEQSQWSVAELVERCGE